MGATIGEGKAIPCHDAVRLLQKHFGPNPIGERAARKFIEQSIEDRSMWIIANESRLYERLYESIESQLVHVSTRSNVNVMWGVTMGTLLDVNQDIEYCWNNEKLTVIRSFSRQFGPETRDFEEHSDGFAFRERELLWWIGDSEGVPPKNYRLDRSTGRSRRPGAKPKSTTHLAWAEMARRAYKGELEPKPGHVMPQAQAIRELLDWGVRNDTAISEETARQIVEHLWTELGWR